MADFLKAVDDDRLRRQLEFVLEIDKLKSVFRRSYLLTGERRENSAEHSWHIAMMAVVLAEYSNETVDMASVLKLAIVHDIVEIDADDTFCYDDAALLTKADREKRAADRIFGLLPDDSRDEMRGIWDEYELSETAEARFAGALDRMMPIMHNISTGGRSWIEHKVTRTQVLTHNAHIADGARQLWPVVEAIVVMAVARGYLIDE